MSRIESCCRQPHKKSICQNWPRFDFAAVVLELILLRRGVELSVSYGHVSPDRAAKGGVGKRGLIAWPASAIVSWRKQVPKDPAPEQRLMVDLG